MTKRKASAISVLLGGEAEGFSGFSIQDGERKGRGVGGGSWGCFRGGRAPSCQPDDRETAG